MSDFDSWVKKQGQPATPKTAAPKPTGGSFDSWVRGDRKPKPATPATVLPQDRQTFGRQPTTLDESLTQSARLNRGRPQPPQPAITPEAKFGPLHEARQDMSRRDFERKPITERTGERVYDALARGGGQLSRMARQTAGVVIGAARKQAAPQNEFQVEDFPRWREFEEERNRELEERRLKRPTSFATEVGEGAIEALPAASAAILGTMATGGSLPAAMAIGGGMSAAGADWNDPKRAAVQTGIGAVAPVVGGMAGGRLGSAVASRLARPVAQAAARGAGEVIGGGAGNVIGTGAEQLAFEGKLNPRELAKSGIIGSALSAPGAVTAARRPARLTEKIPAAQPVVARQPEVAPVVPRVEPPQPAMQGFGIKEAFSNLNSGGNWRDALRASVAKNGKLPGPERNSSVGRAYDAAIAQGAPPNVATLDAVLQSLEQASAKQPAPPRTQQPPDVTRTTAEIPKVPTAPTQRIQYPDAPATQEMPTFKQWMEAKNAPTRELPAPPIAQEPTNRITEGEGAELPPRIGRQLEGQPTETRVQLPKATDENINQLRARYEELGREAYDRRGDFTGDLRDEYSRLNSVIREYDNARTPGEFTPPARGAERFTPPEGERSARREALQPRTGPMPETLTEGQKVTQEMQIPSALKPTEAFSSREDARQGYFQQFGDDELVQEIGRMQDIQNEAVSGRSKLTREQLKANEFDLRVAIDMQKEIGRQQRAIGVDPANRIAPRSPGRAPRKIQHSTLGEVTESANQKGVPSGKLRVEAEGKESIIQNPRTKGNRSAAFVKSSAPPKAKSLAQFVKESGGIKPSVANRGELSYASRKESNRVAIVNRRGIAADEMRRQAEEAGFGKWDTESEFLSALRDDVEGRKVFSTEREVDYEVEYRKSLSKDEEAELDSFDKFLNDKDAADTYDRVSGGDVSGEAVNKLIQHAKRYGLADDSVEAIINEGRSARSSQGQASEILPNNVASQGEAPSQTQLASKSKPPDLVQGMKRIARSPSSPVEISQLRAKFPELSKTDFDAQMLKLRDEGRIALHRDDRAASMSEAERAKLIKSGNKFDDYYTAANFTERPGEVMGMGLGPFQKFIDRGKEPQGQQALFGEQKPKRSRGQIAETAGGVQTLAQLGNPRFVIRNVLQHVAFGKQERVATRVAAALDWAISKGSGTPRQVFAPRGSDLAQYVRNWGKVIKAHKEGQPLPGKPNVDYATADANKLDKAVGKVMTWINEIPDAANWQTRFEQSLQSITGNKKVGALDSEAVVDQAMMEANRASLRDSNFVSSALLNIKKGLNKLSSPVFGTDKFGAGDFILKYAQTPGALLKRGLERSPLGLFQVAKEAATPGPFRRRNTLLALSRVAEGAATGAGLGAALAAAGVLVGPEEESKTGKAFEREEGKRGYSFNASALRRLLTGESTEMAEGDQLYSIDWLQPWAMNLSAGAAVYNLHKDGKLGAGSAAKGTGEAIYNSLAKTLDVMGDQSVLKNLTRYMDRAVGETFADKIGGFVKAIGLDVPSSFVPSLARQTRQVVDPFERDTRPEERGGFAGFMKESAGRALAQVPGLSESFPKRPSLLTGEDRKTPLGEMSVPGRIAAQFSPSNVSTYTPRPVAREISRLNQSGQKVSISFPAPKKGEPTSELRGRERRLAETFSKMSSEMIKDVFYKDADNEMKAAAFAGLKRHLANMGKEDFEEKTVEEIVEDAIEAVERKRDKEQDQ